MQVYAEQLTASWKLVQRGSRAAGVDGMTTDLFAGIAQEQIRQLQVQLRQEHYAASPAKGFFLAKPNGGRRLIGIPTVRDRIVQRYLLQMIYPQLEQVFSEACYAYRPGYSRHGAVEQVLSSYQHQPAWVIRGDIQQFFDNLCWAVLLNQLERLPIASTFIRLVEQQLHSGLIINGQYCRTRQGVLQGGILSGALANLYLCEFDARCLETGIHLVRYGDDFAVVCSGWMQASRILNQLTDWLNDIYLDVHSEKTRIFAPDEPFTFLGYEFCRGEAINRAIDGRQKQDTKAKQVTPKPHGLPKVCSIIRSTEAKLTQPIEHFWREPMTTLYVSEQGAFIRVHHHQFQVVSKDREAVRCSVPVNQVSHIVVFGCSNLTHGAVSLALRRRIPVLYLSSDGKYFGRLITSGQAEIEYMTRQVLASQDPAFVQRQARAIIQAKIHNSRILLMRLNRRRKTETATQAIEALAQLMDTISTIETIEAMLGYEGQAAALYFRAFASLLKGSFAFEQRTRRPPTDPVNSLLSLGYTLLSQNIHAMVETVGLHTHFGNLHTPRKNHPALVSDLVEEFRAPVVDSLVAYLINTNLFTPEDFTPPDERGGVYLFPDALKKFLKQWEETLQKEVTHPHTGYKVSYRRCFELQVREYIACLMGDRDTYRPMKWTI